MAKLESYLALGQENRQKQDWVDAIRQSVQKKIAIESHRFYGYEMDFKQVIALLQSPSLFGEIPWIEIHMAESLKKGDIKDLVQYLKKNSEKSVGYLIFVSDEEYIDKTLEQVIKPAHRKVFKPLAEDEILDYLKRYLQEKYAYDIADETIELLLSRMDSDTQQLLRMLDFLVRVPENEQLHCISVESVRDYVSQMKEVNVHDLFYVLATRNLEKTLEIAEQLWHSKEGLNVMTLIVLNRSFKGLIDYKSLLQEGYTPQGALKELRIFYQRAESTKIASHHYTEQELRAIMASSVGYDLAARDGDKERVKNVVIQYLVSCCTQPFSLYDDSI
ncbi:DNA polymerase III subunit delta [Entomospira entomophila]|uniref:DNA polymerase III subunit delta n=1 Tax=Entomospira entomophila TaxID=2719988 RepID=A0A968G9S8_9SPIO|nr:DNA polymerase III subunit delta [Entomospira entomophilus]NIZ40537.1 DNA polymerase III subunit delta [Entomospira entomophilus]WDI36095.1 DNA polymerase III subunit delta [Entomospira entomophilus]